MALLLQNTGYTRAFILLSTSDNATGVTGQSPVITLYKGASTTSSSSTGTIKELGNGLYTIGLTSNDTTTVGDLVIHATSTAGWPADWADQVVVFNLGSATVTVGTNNDKTGYSIAAGGVGAGAHSAAELNNIADGVLDRNMAAGTDSGTDSTGTRTPRQALRILRNKTTVTATSTTAGNIAVTKEDDSTNSWTAAVTFANNDPLTSVDPA